MKGVFRPHLRQSVKEVLCLLLRRYFFSYLFKQQSNFVDECLLNYTDVILYPSV